MIEFSEFGIAELFIETKCLEAVGIENGIVAVSSESFVLSGFKDSCRFSLFPVRLGNPKVGDIEIVPVGLRGEPGNDLATLQPIKNAEGGVVGGGVKLIVVPGPFDDRRLIFFARL
ncbi:hypothetical protein N9221_01050 [Akkermansiaceae bacterium]|nr:hypothetical protein [bacterium]MDB4308611.1 hypothetical protein [bacterium]MDB4414562.1 hypothetical protein [bacterium]MDB4505231.1 hypothetical protein [Akkermansiaceae bacterium]